MTSEILECAIAMTDTSLEEFYNQLDTTIDRTTLKNLIQEIAINDDLRTDLQELLVAYEDLFLNGVIPDSPVSVQSGPTLPVLDVE